MFVRKKPVRGLRLLKEFFYPDMGYVRTLRYLYHRIIRLSDKSHKIAAGLAIGAAISFSPLIGTHFIQAFGLAYFFRANYLAAMIGTFWGNPWTFPFLWLSGYQVGQHLFSFFGLNGDAALPDSLTMSELFDIVTAQPMSLFLPWMLGGYICAALFWPLAFVVSYVLVRAAKIARQKKFKAN